MATQLQPQTLDIKITKICPQTVKYVLWANKQAEEWEQPNVSTFDKSTLQVGVRYTVKTKAVNVVKFNYVTKKREVVERYDWVTATLAVPKAKLSARTKKQRLAAEVAASMPLVDDSLFVW